MKPFTLFRPPEIVQDIYPHLQSCKSPNSSSSNFDIALGSIINIIVSFDTGWSKRGNGRSYDSLNGYSTIIGFLSGKILDYAARNRKCCKCDVGKDKENKHDCAKNFEGSAKAMETHAGNQLINHSNILKEANLQVRVIVGDEDSSMIAAVRADNPLVTLHKLADKNHLVKNFNNELFKLRENHKELKKPDNLNHIKKCFTYALDQNRGDPANLAKALNSIPYHLFSIHEHCGEWCKKDKDHTVVLKETSLHTDLKNFFSLYANNAEKFSVYASSQANESFNNIVAHKAPKNICLSRTASCDIRVADSVCTKNDGDE